MLRIVTLFLSRLGYQVSAANRAEEAMRNDPFEFDLVVTDLFMPGKSGVDLMEWIRARNPRVKVVIMSGAIPAGGPLRAALNSADRLIPKPFQLADFRAALLGAGDC